MNPDIQVTLEAERLVRALQDLGGIMKKDPDVKAGLKEASRYLVNKGRERLKSHTADTKAVSKSMTFALYRNKRGSLVGFKIPDHAYDPRSKWECMRAAVFNSGTKLRKTRKGYNRGLVKGNKF